MKEHNVPVLVVSLGDLLWSQERTLQRVHAFLPALAHTLNTSFVPQLGRDIYSGNHFKAHGSIASFARKVGPPARFGYDVKERKCMRSAGATSSLDPEIALQTQAERDEAQMLVRYLEKWSL